MDGDDLNRERKNLEFRQLINRGTFTDFYVKEKRVQGSRLEQNRVFFHKARQIRSGMVFSTEKKLVVQYFLGQVGETRVISLLEN